MKTLSVVLATFNEEQNLRNCLESIKEIADEIVIVDGSSTDKTVAIAKQFKAKILVTDNPQIFHINKQKAIDMATKDWILQLDADEVVSKKLAQEIKEKTLSLRSSVLNPVVGFWLPRKNWFLGRFLMKGGQYPDYTLRLYLRGKGRLPQQDVHEQAIVEGEVGFLQGALLHYPYRDFTSYLKKWNRYVSIIALQTKTKLENKSFLYQSYFAMDQLLFAPIAWFLLTFVRHKGFMDGWQGFIFAFYSALRFPASYLLSLVVHEKV